MKETFPEDPYITTGDLIRLLFEKEPEDLAGLIPAESVAFAGETVNRKTAATLIHIYLTEVLKEPDITDISKASVLKDLYDCRVCVRHIAQVYLKGIMEAVDYPELSKTGEPGSFLIFDGNGKVTKEEALIYRDRVLNTLQRLKNSAK